MKTCILSAPTANSRRITRNYFPSNTEKHVDNNRKSYNDPVRNYGDTSFDTDKEQFQLKTYKACGLNQREAHQMLKQIHKCDENTLSYMVLPLTFIKIYENVSIHMI